MININALTLYLFIGDKGSGKSLFAAKLADYVLKQYKRVEKRYPQLPKRYFYSHEKFSSSVEKAFDNRLVYWENYRQLYGVRNADIYWDEVQKDIPQDSWKDAPRELRQVFSHCRKRGNRIFLCAQNLKDIDVSCKRQISYLYRLRKWFGSRDISATMPPVKRVWGLVSLTHYDVQKVLAQDDFDLVKPKSFFPSFFTIRKKFVDMYDTTAEIAPFRPDELEHIVYSCKHPGCTYHTKVEHRKI